MLRRAYLRASPVLKALPPLLMVVGGMSTLLGQDWLLNQVSSAWIRWVEPWDLILYLCLPVCVASLLYTAGRRFIEVALIRREMKGPVCPKCKSSLIGLRVETRGTIPDPAQNRVRCPECGSNWRMLDIGLTPRDLAPPEFGLAGAGTRRPLRGE